MKAPKSHEWRRTQFCYWCGTKVHYVRRGHKAFVGDDSQATRDHLEPRSTGATGALSNVVVACNRCNNARGSRMDWVPFHLRHGAERGTVEVEGVA